MADRPAAGGTALLRKIVTFAHILREAGFPLGPDRVRDAVSALTAVDIRSRDQCYWALRCTLTSRHEEVEVFDSVFTAFWNRESRAEPAAAPPDDPSDGGERGLESTPQAALQERESVTTDDLDDDEAGGEQQAAWSAVERLQSLDFASYTDEELRLARRLLEPSAQNTPTRRSRRLRPANDGTTVDKRRMLRSAMRTEGYPLVRPCRRPRLVPRKTLYLVDVSGSMEPYARAMLMFLHAAVGPGRKVEAFTFGTRLTRITRELAAHEPDRALEAATRAVPDWAGGTRIGDTVKALNDGWGRRGITRGAVVVVLSDGWERGEVGLLSREMARLRRAAHSIVWVNPLAGDPGYEPLAQGMAAALPFVDRFLAGHDLRSLEALAEVLVAVGDAPLHRVAPATRGVPPSAGARAGLAP